MTTDAFEIVLIDDDQLVLTSLKLLLKMMSYNVTAFTEPSRALQYLRTKRPDSVVIICDQRMPPMTGVEFFHALPDSLHSRFILPSGAPGSGPIPPVPTLIKPAEPDDIRTMVESMRGA